MKALLTKLKNTSPKYWRKGRNSRRWTSSKVNCATTVNLCLYSSYRQLAPQQDYPQSSLCHKQDGNPSTLVHHTWSPGSNTVWVWGGWRPPYTKDGRWTPTQYLKSFLPTATVWNVGHKGVHAVVTLNPAAHSADVKVAWLQNAKMSSVKHKHS